MTHQRKRPSRLITAFGLALLASLALTAFGASSASALKLTSGEGGTHSPEIFAMNNAPDPAIAEISAVSLGSYTCENSGATGGFDKGGETGSITLTFAGCKINGAKCTTAGQTAGTIRTPELDFKLVYLDAAKTHVGFHLTAPPSTPFAKCSWGLFQVPVEWNGSFLIGVNASLNESKASFPLEINGSAGQQQYQQIEGAGPLYHLSHSIGGGAPSDMAIATGWKIGMAGLYKFVS